MKWAVVELVIGGGILLIGFLSHWGWISSLACGLGGGLIGWNIPKFLFEKK